MADKDDIISLGVELDVKGAVRAVGRFRKDMDRNMGAVSKKAEAFAKLTKKANKAAVKSTEAVTDAVEDLTDAYEGESKVVKELERRLARAHGDEKRNLQDEIDLLREANKERGRVPKKPKSKKPGKSGKPDIDGMDEGDWKKGAKEAAGEFRDGIRAAFSKDLKGAIEGAFKGSTKTVGMLLKGGLNFASNSLQKRGSNLSALGGGLLRRGASKGGAAGSAMGLAGGGLKALGGMMAKMGPLIQSLTKLGPALELAGAGVMAIVKLFIDAEAQAKDFQKEILQTASTTEFLANAGYDGGEAFANLEQTVKGVRDAAFSFSNIEWGITAEETKTVVSALNQEGVSLATVGTEAARANASVKDFTEGLVHSSVAYSRAFGVPLQELSQMQSEMFVDLGKNLQESRMAFAQMTRAAGESGIASNKFFAIIRGVSADLSLYNNRLEDAVKTLTLLGKVMNPRNAAKFMSTATQALRNKGRSDLLKMHLLGGSDTKLLSRELDRKARDIGNTIAEAGGKAGLSREDLMSKPVEDLLQGVSKEQRGAINDALQSFRMDTKSSKKGVYGQAMAMRNFSPAAAAQALKNSLNITGTGKLADRAGDLGTQQLAEAGGTSMEEYEGFAKLELAIDDERETLKKGLAKNDPAVLERLTKAGLKTANDIDKAGMDQIYDAMDPATKELAKVDAGIEDAGKAQAKLTNSLLSKLSQLVDWFMNQFYDLMKSILDAIESLNPNSKKDPLKDIKEKVAKSGNSELYAASKSNDVKGAVSSTTVVASFNKALDSISKQDDAIKAAQETFKTSKDPKVLEKAAASMNAALAQKSKVLGAAGTVANSYTPDQITEAMKMAFPQLSQKDLWAKQNAFMDAVKGGKSNSEALSSTLSQDELLDTIRKTTWITGNYGQTETADASKNADLAGARTLDAMLEVSKQLDLGNADAAKGSAAVQALAKEGATPGAESLTVKFGPNFLKSKLRPALEKSMLSALRTALFEYYMYSEMDRSEVAKYMKDTGMGIDDFSKQMGEMAQTGVSGSGLLGKNAAGGIVAGVGGGLATVRAAAGEGLASVGPGERIVPAGGGGGGNSSVNLYVNGIGGNDLGQFLRAKIIDGIAEYKRRERFS